MKTLNFTCGDCKQNLTEVRPGKHQCDNINCKSNKTDKDLFGEKVPVVYFKAATTKQDNGWTMCACGTSISDNQNYLVTTHYLKSDEIPELCNDAKTFAELVAKLLNEYYNK